MASKSNNRVLTLSIAVATLGGLLFGYDTAVISGTVGSLENFFVTPLGLPEFEANSLIGFTVSSALIGCICGGVLGGFVADKLGRRNSLRLAAFLFLFSAVGSSFPEIFVKPFGTGDHTFLTQFIIYRIIGGVGVGLASMVSPMYIAELAPAERRGGLVSLNQFAIIFGMLLVYFVNYAIANQGDDNWLNDIGWRWMFLSEAIPATLFLVLLTFIPETPRCLVMQNKQGKAIEVLNKIYNKTEAVSILKEIEQSANSKEEKRTKVLYYGSRVLIIGLLLSVFQQFVGINVVLYYAPEIFKSMGASTDSSLLQTIVVGIINLLFTVVAIVSVDKFGRKPLLVIGALGMAFSMFLLGGTFYADSMGMLSLIAMLIYTASFAVSWGPIVWVMLAEIFPNKIRGVALAMAVAIQWVANYTVSWTFPMMKDSSFLQDMFNNSFPYLVYGVMSILAAIFVIKYIPETKGKTLEDMEKLWKKD